MTSLFESLAQHPDQIPLAIHIFYMNNQVSSINSRAQKAWMYVGGGIELLNEFYANYGVMAIAVLRILALPSVLKLPI
jgi:hypothetical protein